MKKLKILLLALAAMISVGAWADVTDGSGLSFTAKTGFGDPKAAGGSEAKNHVYEIWTNNASAVFDLNQEVTSLSEGIYELSAIAMYRASFVYGTPTNCVLYATVEDKTYTVPIKNFGDCTASNNIGGVANAMVNHKSYSTSIPYIIVKNGSAKIGMKSLGALTFCDNGYWFMYDTGSFTFKNVTSDYYSKLSARATKMLETASEGDAKTALSNALSTYNSATLDNVEGLKAAINAYLVAAASDTNPIDVTSYIANPSFDGGSLKFWMQDFGYKQAADMYQPNNWDLCYSSQKVDNTQWQTFKPQTDGAKDGNCLYVRHRWNDVLAIENLRQTVKELPAGKYTLTVAVKGGSNVTDPNTLTLTAGANTNTTTIGDFDKENYKDYSVSLVKSDVETNLDICYGFEQKAAAEQLYYIDDFRLYYNGEMVSDEDAAALIASIPTGKMYVGASSSMQSAKEALEASKSLSNYKALSAAIEAANASIADYAKLKDAIDNYYYPIDPDYDGLVSIIAAAKDHYEKADLESCSESIASLSMSSDAVKTAMVNDYMYVTGTTETPGNYIYGVSLGDWTTTGYVSTFNNEHWSGTTHDYKNQDDSNGRGWNSPTGFEIGLNQNIKLPAGNYIFKACGRKSDGAVLELLVKSGDNVIGRVANFPSSNNAKGIDKNGVTSFDGTNFANNGNGFGWQWRYVAFTLTEETTINVAVSASATSGQQWVSFGDYTIQTDDEANLAMIAYNIALNDAELALANDAYKNVTGAELIALNEAIAFVTEGKTKTEIEEATTALQEATSAFKAAAPAYDNYIAVLAKVENLDDAGKAKFAELTESIVEKYNDNTIKAEDLADVEEYYFAAIKAQTTPNKDWSDLIINNSFEEGTVNGWTNSGSVALGALSTNPANNPKVGNWFVEKWGTAGSVDFNQTISDLPAGSYKVTVRARNEADAVAYLYANDEKVAFVKNTTNTYSTNVVIANTGALKIGVSCENHPGNTWLAVDHFTLTYLGAAFDATLTTVGDAAYSTMFLNFPVEIPENVEAYYVTVSGKTATMNPIEGVIPANCGVILKAAENVDKVTFTQTSTEATTDVSSNVLIGFVEDTEVNNGKAHYAFSYKDDKVGFYIPASAESGTDPTSKFTAKAHKAYIELESAPNSKLDIAWGGEATGINTIDNGQLTIDNSKAYNLNGMRVSEAYKGIVLKGGKKFLQK